MLGAGEAALPFCALYGNSGGNDSSAAPMSANAMMSFTTSWYNMSAVGISST